MATKPPKAKNGDKPPDDKWKQREKVFGLYRDMGSKRSIAVARSSRRRP